MKFTTECKKCGAINEEYEAECYIDGKDGTKVKMILPDDIGTLPGKYIILQGLKCWNCGGDIEYYYKLKE
jgi:hypothetical protein